MTESDRQIRARRQSLIAFDVGVGRTYTALAVIARLSAERVRRPRVAREECPIGDREQEPEQS